MELRNILKDEVLFILDNVLKDMDDVCKCQQCRLDIAAIALNNLKPKYVVTEKGYVFSKTDSLKPQFSTDIITEITKAIDIVRNNPRHK